MPASCRAKRKTSRAESTEVAKRPRWELSDLQTPQHPWTLDVYVPLAEDKYHPVISDESLQATGMLIFVTVLMKL